MLRHLGVTRMQIGQMLASEGFVLGMLGVIVGLHEQAAVVSDDPDPTSSNRQSFHRSMDVFVPTAPALAALQRAILIVSAALIAVVSGRSAMPWATT